MFTVNLRFQGHSANILSKTEPAFRKTEYPAANRYLEKNQNGCGLPGRWIGQFTSCHPSLKESSRGKTVDALGWLCETQTWSWRVPWTRLGGAKRTPRAHCSRRAGGAGVWGRLRGRAPPSVTGKTLVDDRGNLQMKSRGSKDHVLQKVKGFIVKRQKFGVERSPTPIPGPEMSFWECQCS